MKKIFKLIFNEIKVMRLPTIFVVLSLILFSAALFSILFVSFNLPNSIFTYFDNNVGPSSVFVHNSSADIPISDSAERVLSGNIDIYTAAKHLKNEKGDVFTTLHTTDGVVDGRPVTIFNSFSGKAIIPNKATLDHYEKYGHAISGTLPKNSFEICLCKTIADELSVAVGDSVYIGGKAFKVTGIMDDDTISVNTYLLSVDETTVFDCLVVGMPTAKQAYNLFTKLNIRGYDADISYRQIVDGVSTANYLLIATAVVLFVANFAMIYSMFSLILLNRRAYVCRLKVLGCNSRTLFLVYFILLVIIIAAVELVAYALSSLITANILNLCSSLFEVPIAAKGNPLIVLAHFVLLAVIVMFMVMRQMTKIKEKAVVETMRGE